MTLGWSSSLDVFAHLEVYLLDFSFYGRNLNKASMFIEKVDVASIFFGAPVISSALLELIPLHALIIEFRFLRFFRFVRSFFNPSLSLLADIPCVCG